MSVREIFLYVFRLRNVTFCEGDVFEASLSLAIYISTMEMFLYVFRLCNVNFYEGDVLSRL